MSRQSVGRTLAARHRDTIQCNRCGSRHRNISAHSSSERGSDTGYDAFRTKQSHNIGHRFVWTQNKQRIYMPADCTPTSVCLNQSCLCSQAPARGAREHERSTPLLQESELLSNVQKLAATSVCQSSCLIRSLQARTHVPMHGQLDGCTLTGLKCVLLADL